MDRSWNEGLAKAVHRKEWGWGGCVTEIIDKRSLCHGGAGSRLRGDDGNLGTIDLIQNEGKGKTSKVASPANASGHDVYFLLSKFLQLFLGLKTNNCLMHHHVV